MRLGSYVVSAISELNKKNIFAGKTNIQKVVYFALPPEQRKAYYKPYHFGPYCTEVQQAVSALLKREVLSKSGKGFALSVHRTPNQEIDQVFGRIRATANFLAEQGLAGTDDIATLAKIHLLSRSEREDARQDLVAYIQSQAKFLGWKELSGEDPEKIQNYLHMANNLDKALEA
jgi:uncharacterized protein YwgA